MPTKVEKDSLSGVDTTGHEWDGIQELNNPLPKWWLYVFYVCVAFSLGYWVLYPAIPLGKSYTGGILGYSQRDVVLADIATARAAQGAYRAKIDKASFEQIEADPDLLSFAIAGGRSAFAENCSACHGAGGAGGKGFPILADDDRLWGGKADDIHTTLLHGVRSPVDGDTRLSEMPKFGVDKLLTAAQIDEVTEYILSFTGRDTNKAAATNGATVFAENCVACHGEKGEGIREVGAPRLNDNIWLYGGDKKTLVETVTYARAGVMPAWGGRLDPITVKQLAVYVHTLGGGEK
jgi:cytochrome c oxidase cbb3-type subunit III